MWQRSILMTIENWRRCVALHGLVRKYRMFEPRRTGGVCKGMNGACYNRIQQGTGCPECARLASFGRDLRPKEPEHYHALAAERGFTWLGPEVANVHINTNWRCPEGHEWPAAYSSIQQGSGCPECAGLKPKVSDDYGELAAQREFTWLGPEVANVHTKTNWRCPEGHEWPAAYANIQQGMGCPECAGFKPKVPDDYRELAAQREFAWLGPEVSNVHTKTNWRCPEGHEWPATYDSIQGGSGCSACAGLKPKISDDYRELAAQRGFAWLGPEVPNVGTNTNWRCPEGHEWPACYSNVQQGTGCPECWRIRKRSS